MIVEHSERHLVTRFIGGCMAPWCILISRVAACMHGEDVFASIQSASLVWARGEVAGGRILGLLPKEEGGAGAPAPLFAGGSALAALAALAAASPATHGTAACRSCPLQPSEVRIKICRTRLWVRKKKERKFGRAKNRFYSNLWVKCAKSFLWFILFSNLSAKSAKSFLLFFILFYFWIFKWNVRKSFIATLPCLLICFSLLWSFSSIFYIFMFFLDLIYIIIKK